jgi:Ca-activated chloride channel family protein
MDYLSQMHFIRPLVLWVLPVVALILWYLQQQNSKEDGWSKICDPHLLDAIKVRSGGQGSRLTWLLWPISLIAVLALAGPAFQKLPTPVIKNQSALVIALDVSKSMLSDDIKPNRLERAKYKINDILDSRKDGQTALLVYSGDAFVVTPLTDDTQTIALMLKAISPEIMPVQGSRVDIALSKAKDLLKQAGYPSGDILLIADGVNISKANKIAKDLANDRIKISVLGVGTKEGAPIPLQTGFVKDSQGNIVIPKLQLSELKELATNGDGRFAQITGDSSDIDYLLPSVIDDEKMSQSFEEEEESFDSQKYIDEGPWLVLLLIPLVALLFRKGLLLGLFLVVGLQSPQSSYAFDFDSFWLNADQQAAKQLQQGDAKKALELAQSNQWKATAAFKNKDYKQAQELFNDGSADGLYNQGNALAAAGKLEQALKSYEESLKIRPQDEDTLFNKKQVEEALKKQQEQQQKDQKNKDKKDQDEQDQDKQNQDQQNQDKKDQEKQDSEDKENQDQKESDGENKEGQQNQEDNPEQKQQEEKPSQMSEEEKKKQEEEQKKLEQADKDAKEQQKEQEVEQEKLTPQEMAEEAENKEAIEQWLRRIPDDPGGLLRRKFYYQYNQQNNKPDETEDW